MRDMLTMDVDAEGMVPVYFEDEDLVRRVAVRQARPEELMAVFVFGEEPGIPDLPGYALTFGAYGWAAAPLVEGIEVYADYHTPTIVYTREQSGWWIVPAVTDGWQRRRPWSPSPLVARRLATPANRVTFYGLAWLAESVLGIPANRVSVVAP